MNTNIKAPCFVKIKSTGKILACRSISNPSRRMKIEQGWKGLVCHVQNRNGTGIVKYSDVCIPTAEELSACKS
jgi:hypothetical protein